MPSGEGASGERPEADAWEQNQLQQTQRVMVAREDGLLGILQSPTSNAPSPVRWAGTAQAEWLPPHLKLLTPRPALLPTAPNTNARGLREVGGGKMGKQGGREGGGHYYLEDYSICRM